MATAVNNNAESVPAEEIRELQHLIKGQRAMDGDGVNLTRIIGTPQLNMLDPFLLLDAFESDQPQDYIGGFPSHPHRGFETVTYLLAGRMRHKDSAGHEGVIEPGGVQWMTAGKGIIHSEMPEQQNGLLMGFQLWVNLPASAKMVDPRYQEFPANKTALEKWQSGTQIRVIAGLSHQGTEGPVRNEYVDPTYMDVELKAEDDFIQTLPKEHTAFIYVIDGELKIGQENASAGAGTLAVLSAGIQVKTSASADSRFLLVAGKPLNEPVARGGPFVMNTKAEILQAFEDFQNNRF
ncbi:pirin family protein [Motiliproteus sp. MSK22-1]|uniref:pirin family protein n=1 Tax=Motiliproteus sp. MSK22-1 TaxID=1897630 RepID=UPI000975F50D|nr:pirin family protein [Motiliproteus sp. MSK22-1]OMH25797.1 quercetin 2,3-dioxygenase [Motiliproteus sp. MSK22-1]